MTDWHRPWAGIVAAAVLFVGLFVGVILKPQDDIYFGSPDSGGAEMVSGSAAVRTRYRPFVRHAPLEDFEEIDLGTGLATQLVLEIRSIYSEEVPAPTYRIAGTIYFQEIRCLLCAEGTRWQRIENLPLEVSVALDEARDKARRRWPELGPIDKSLRRASGR